MIPPSICKLRCLPYLYCTSTDTSSNYGEGLGALVGCVWLRLVPVCLGHMPALSVMGEPRAKGCPVPGRQVLSSTAVCVYPKSLGPIHVAYQAWGQSLVSRGIVLSASQQAENSPDRMATPVFGSGVVPGSANLLFSWPVLPVPGRRLGPQLSGRVDGCPSAECKCRQRAAVRILRTCTFLFMAAVIWDGAR